jgi:hypothetical protein
MLHKLVITYSRAAEKGRTEEFYWCNRKHFRMVLESVKYGNDLYRDADLNPHKYWKLDPDPH